jgi:ribosomal protein L11 methyltransferase
MWVWSKLSSAKWRDAWEERFQAFENTQLVLTTLAGQQSVRVEIFCSGRHQAERVRRQFGGRVRRLKSHNWAAMAAPKIAPIKIRDRLLVVSDHDPRSLNQLCESAPDRKVLLIPVEMAFGTGDHPTTATCLRLLCDLDPVGKRVLDLGCGTGILALAAKALGARHVLGIDFDREAVAVSNRNAARNRIAGVRFERRDLLEWEPRAPFDIIMANIFADVLNASFARLKRALAPGGALIVSGVLDTHAADSWREARSAGFRFERFVRRGKWVTALARSEGKPPALVTVTKGHRRRPNA